MNITPLLLKTYSLTKRTGLLDIPPVKKLFVHSYNAYKRHLEDPFYKLCKKRPDLLAGGHIFDVGANIGYTAKIFSEGVDDGFSVYAFEPEEDNFLELTRSLGKAIQSEKLFAILGAVGEENGELKLWKNLDHHADHRVVTDSFLQAKESPELVKTVPQYSLDSFVEQENLQDPVSFIKIDVQGYEMPVLMGASRIVRESPKLTIALEYSPLQMEELGFNPSAVFEWIETNGFEVQHLDLHKPLQALSRSELDGLASERGYVDLLLTK